MRSVDKYLSTYAEEDIQHLDGIALDRPLSHCIVVPVFNETTAFIDRLASGPLAAQTLLIVVINQAENFTDTTGNRIFFHDICEKGDILWQNAPLFLIRLGPLYVLLVDRYSEKKIPVKEGVGKARKIGCDIAVALFRQNRLASPVIFSTDADAHLPANYFAPEREFTGDISAVVFDFEHKVDDSPLGRATTAYEQAIKYYRRGLAWAGSPYAFYTLGSTLAFDITHYCQVRGFPKRAAAEDFYLLNKLAKTGGVHFIPDVKIQIDARLSDRVPFGTGPAVKKILDTWERGESYRYYNPESFIYLKHWLERQNVIAGRLLAGDDPLSAIGDGAENEKEAEAIKAIDFDRFLAHAKTQCKNTDAYLRDFHHWFDGFRTLKFIRFLQAGYFPALTLEDCLARGQQLFSAT